MDKFTKMKETKNVEKKEILFQNDWLKIKEKDDYVFLEESDSVCVIPFFIEKNRFYLRQEIITPFKVKDNADFHMTCISGTVEENESHDECIRRELTEEAGIVLRDSYKINIIDSLYKSKTGNSKFIYAILPISEYEYTTVAIKGDGSILEKNSKTIAIDVKNINRIKPADVITKLLILELKNYLNIHE